VNGDVETIGAVAGTELPNVAVGFAVVVVDGPKENGDVVAVVVAVDGPNENGNVDAVDTAGLFPNKLELNVDVVVGGFVPKILDVLVVVVVPPNKGVADAPDGKRLAVVDDFRLSI
jgi:hypothetical protein